MGTGEVGPRGAAGRGSLPRRGQCRGVLLRGSGGRPALYVHGCVVPRAEHSGAVQAPSCGETRRAGSRVARRDRGLDRHHGDGRMSEPTKVFLVSQGNYSDYRIEAVFSTREKAEAYVADMEAKASAEMEQ